MKNVLELVRKGAKIISKAHVGQGMSKTQSGKSKIIRLTHENKGRFSSHISIH